MPDHPPTDELAALVLGESGATGADHVASCEQCQAELAQVAEITTLLGLADVEPTPPAVAARLGATLQAELDREREGRLQAEREAALLQAASRTELGSFGPNLALGKKDFSPVGRHSVAARNRAMRSET